MGDKIQHTVGEEVWPGTLWTADFGSLQMLLLGVDSVVLKLGRGKGQLLLKVLWTVAETRRSISKRRRARWILRQAG